MFKWLNLLLPFILLTIFLTNTIEVKAMHTGFDTEELSEETKERIISYIQLTLLETAPENRGIRCFDVNEHGMIAVTQEHGLRKKEICVYSSQGEFLYGYAFRTDGIIAVEWDHDNLNILFVRGGELMSLDRSGNILDIKDIPTTIKNNRYENELLYTFKRTVGDTTYQIRNDQGPILNFQTTSFSQIVVTDPDGTERIIYDVNETERNKKIVVFILIGIFVVHVVGGLIVFTVFSVKYFRKLRKLWNGEGWS